MLDHLCYADAMLLYYTDAMLLYYAASLLLYYADPLLTLCCYALLALCSANVTLLFFRSLNERLLGHMLWSAFLTSRARLRALP